MIKIAKRQQVKVKSKNSTILFQATRQTTDHSTAGAAGIPRAETIYKRVYRLFESPREKQMDVESVCHSSKSSAAVIIILEI